jgi:hypothetical protein
MNTFTHCSVLVFLATTAGVSALALQDSRKPEGVQTTPAAASKMAEKWKEFGTPGAAHKVLEERVGTWAVEVKMFETPGAAPTTTNGKSTIQSILDGRFIQETASGVWMGQPFMGIGTMGYDNLKKKYVSSWIDSMGTALTTAEGTYDDATRTFTLTGECPDVMAGKYTHVRTLEKQIDADHWTIAKYMAGADGKEVLAGQLDYTRAK